jgi:FkbM family methyltransferase
MNIQPSQFPLQRIVGALPKPLHRVKVAQLLAKTTGSPYHRIRFQQGEVIGNVRDSDIANYLVKQEFADHGYFELASRILKEGDVHVDVGANYGFHTFGLLELPISPQIKFVLIDANPDCIACLNESAKLHPVSDFQILHAAAAVETGEIQFSFADSSSGRGHVGAAENSIEGSIRVPARTLDSLFEEISIDKIALMKIDIEGSEPVAMQSLDRMLSSHDVDFIYFEVNPYCLELQQTSPEALFDEFIRHGYRLFWPHDGEDWILRTYGHDNATASDLKRFTIVGNRPHQVIEFDQSLYRKKAFGQCDLLAVSPNCRINSSDPCA